MVDQEKLGKAFLHYTTAEVMFLLVGIPLLVLLTPVLFAAYGIYLFIVVLSILGGIAAIFFRQFKEDDTYNGPSEVALILSPILLTPIFSGLAGTTLYALSKRKNQVEAKAAETVREFTEEKEDSEKKATDDTSDEDPTGEESEDEDSDEISDEDHEEDSEE